MKVVFHLNHLDNLSTTLSNISNILKMDIEAVILLINGPAIKIFLEPSLEPQIKDSRFKIYACENSMRTHNISNDNLFNDAESVPSGVFTLTQLQSKGYAYIKP